MASHDAFFPDVDFMVNGTGLTIRSKRLTTPRFVPWDKRGKCAQCGSHSVEVDYLLQPHGITLFCNRLREPTWVPFDNVRQWRNGQAVRIRSRSKVLNMKLTGIFIQKIIQNSIKKSEEYGDGEQMYDKKGQPIPQQQQPLAAVKEQPEETKTMEPEEKKQKLEEAPIVADEELDKLITQALNDIGIDGDEKKGEQPAN